MKNGNVTVLAIGITLVASIAFAGGYFLGLDRDSSSDAVKTLTETVARQENTIKAYETKVSQARGTEGNPRFQATGPEAIESASRLFEIDSRTSFSGSQSPTQLSGWRLFPRPCPI